MTHVAATMMAQSGDMFANQTPNGDVMAPPSPTTSPNFGTHVFPRICPMLPEMAVKMMANSDVAVHTMGAIPNPNLNTGIMIVPPPMPSMPDSTPMTRPMVSALTRGTTPTPNMPPPMRLLVAHIQLDGAGHAWVDRACRVRISHGRRSIFTM